MERPEWLDLTSQRTPQFLENRGNACSAGKAPHHKAVKQCPKSKRVPYITQMQTLMRLMAPAESHAKSVRSWGGLALLQVREAFGRLPDLTAQLHSTALNLGCPTSQMQNTQKPVTPACRSTKLKSLLTITLIVALSIEALDHVCKT
eukprot:1160648-Pelagomonas_calceolata.AAC.5